MLILSRGKEQSVVITVPPSQVPQQVTVMVLEFRGDKTRLGFQADREVRINRSEIEERIDAEKKAGIEYDAAIGQDYA